MGAGGRDTTGIREQRLAAELNAHPTSPATGKGMQPVSTASYRNRARRDYVTIRNAALRDDRLSLKAKGALAMMLTFVDGWTYRLGHLEGLSRDGRDALRSAIRELELAGYITRHQSRGPDGRLAEAVYHVADDAATVDGKPADGESVAGQPVDGQAVAGETVDGKTDDGQTVAGESAPKKTDSKKTEDKKTEDLLPPPAPTQLVTPTPLPAEPGRKEPPPAVEELAITASASPSQPPTTGEQALPAAPPGRRETAAERTERRLRPFIDAWNTNRGTLPRAREIDKTRAKGLELLITEHGYDEALALLADAAKFVSRLSVYQDGRHGIDALLRSTQGRVLAYAEKQRDADATGNRPIDRTRAVDRATDTATKILHGLRSRKGPNP